MFGDLLYIQNGLGITFDRQRAIRRRANDFEDRLEDKYAQPQVIPVPDDLSAEVPRIIFGSKHGHSQIVISQVNISLTVRYSTDYQQDISKGQDYVLERAGILFDLLKVLDDIEPYYCGLSTIVRIPAVCEEKDLIDHLGRYFEKDLARDAYDVQFKVTNVVAGHYFNNMTIQNYRSWKKDDLEQHPLRVSAKNVIDRGVQIVGDYNDRYACNEDRDYRTSSEEAQKVIRQGINAMQDFVKRFKL